MVNLYQNKAWNSLNPLDRAQLLLVIEGLKRGAIIGGNFTSCLEILKLAGLEYQVNSSKFDLYPTYEIAKGEDLKEAIGRRLVVPYPSIRGEFHEITGWLIGYPSCCITEYSRRRTPEELRAKPRHLSYKLGRELEDRIRRTGEYLDVLDYRPPSFTPCGIECPEATKMLQSYKDALETLDPEAGQALAIFNRQNPPMRSVHMKSLQDYYRACWMEEEIRLLRKSINND